MDGLSLRTILIMATWKLRQWGFHIMPGGPGSEAAALSYTAGGNTRR